MELPSGEQLEHRGAQPGPAAHLAVHRWRLIWRLMASGDIGFAQSYRDGDWSSRDLTDLLTWAMRNERMLAQACEGAAVARLASRVGRRLRANTPANSRRNASVHYDLGNEFYAGWLDAGMNYSSALYLGPHQSLEAAQTSKIDRIVALLDLKGGERVLEIGCGWGALAERLIAAHGCHVTGLTLSERQRDYAARRLDRRNLGTRADIRLEDYRDATGAFDRVVSIEMVEAVGEAYWPVYFAKLRERLAPGGVAVLQAITIDAERFEAYRRQPDFIQTHVFPGGMLPSAPILDKQIAAAGLTLLSKETFAESYALTLAEWRRRFDSFWPEILGRGFDERFGRLWRYYLAYCETGFATGMTDVGLYKIAR